MRPFRALLCLVGLVACGDGAPGAAAGCECDDGEMCDSAGDCRTICDDDGDCASCGVCDRGLCYESSTCFEGGDTDGGDADGGDDDPPPDIVAPVVVATRPTHLAESQLPSLVVTVELDEVIATGSATLTLVDAASASVSGSSDVVNGDHVVFT